MRFSSSFADIPDKEFWPPLVDCFDYVKFKAGEFLTHNGDFADRMFILLLGKAAQYLPNELYPNTLREPKQGSCQPAIDKVFWEDFLVAVGDQKVERFGLSFLDSLTKGIIKPEELFLLGSGRFDDYCTNGLFRFHFAKYLSLGQVIGEIEMNSKGSHIGTVVAVEDCELVVLRKDKLDYFLCGKAIQERRNREVLRIALHLSHDLCTRLAHLFTVSKHRMSEEIYRQGSRLTYIYLITAGVVEVDFTNRALHRGENKIRGEYRMQE